MGFKPEAPKPAHPVLAPRSGIDFYTVGQDAEEFRNRIDAAALKSNLSISEFCWQAIEYALDNMEDE